MVRKISARENRAFLKLLIIISIFQLIPGQQRISQIKCKEFRDLTLTRAVALALTAKGHPIVFESFNCSRLTKLIVGGEEVDARNFPHQALLGWATEDPDKYQFSCGGSLISEKYVLTAAHCTIRNSEAPVVVRLGENDLEEYSDYEADFDIANIIRHSKYSFFRAYHDIALVELKQSVYFTNYIRPACLWTSTELHPSTAIATGFGYQMTGYGMSNTLRMVALEEQDRIVCQDVYQGLREFRRGIIPQQLCYGRKEGGRDTCQGDSGGPLQVTTDSQECTFYIVGITSVGVTCGAANAPSIYTGVASYIEWIEDVVWPGQ